jgi:hypothetical protein
MMSKLGHLDRIDAFEFAHYLCLTGVGSNPTLGWTNWFSPIHALPNTYEFRQEPPAGTVLPVVMPVHVMGVFAGDGAEEVVVRHMVKGRPIEVQVPLRPISRIEEEAISGLMSASALCYLRNRGSDGLLASAGSSFTMRLGSVDIPFACGRWNDPPRPRRYDVRLNVDALLPRPTDIETAVLECFAQGSVAAALATLLTPAGWAGGLADFQEAVESGLLALLGDRLVNVAVTASSRCLEGAVPHFTAQLNGLPLPTVC